MESKGLGTGLYYYRARYYSPTLKRFISEDPIGFSSGDVNFYAYVGNSPTNFIDPLGLVLTPEQCAAAREILRREALFGTVKAAQMSAISKFFLSKDSDQLLSPFNSDNANVGSKEIGGNIYLENELIMDLDWFTDIQANGQGLPFPAYIFGKGVLQGVGIRLIGGYFTNSLQTTMDGYPWPFSDPGEFNAVFWVEAGFGYKDIFTENYMKTKCPCY